MPCHAMPCHAIVVVALCRSSYDYVMVTDDDLIMDACTIDTFFQVSCTACVLRLHE